MFRVLIVDDHESMRETLNRTLSELESYLVVGEISSAAYALLYCKHLNVDLVLMDICTEGNASGLTAIREIKAERPETRVIAMTGFNEISYLPRAREAGADAFVNKSHSLAYFTEVVERVMKGQQVFPEEADLPLPGGESPLTPREMEVLRLVCKHMTNKEIAAELCISENTVKYHKANMLAKTNFSTAVDLAFYMITNGWINPLF